jgi:hypothetical protein
MLGLAHADEPVEETDILSVDYVDILKDEPAPFDGKLFTVEALAKILSNHEAELQTQNIEHQFEIESVTLDLNLKYDILETRYNSEVLMYTTMIDARDEQLRKAAKKDLLQKWGVYGGFVLGAATSVAIFYSVHYH